MGTYHGIRATKYGIPPEETTCNWCRFNNITTVNNGGNNVEYGILFENALGCGNIFSNSSMVAATSGLEFRGSDGSGVGDHDYQCHRIRW